MTTAIKKMMIATAIAGGVLAAKSEIKSSNTVGYLNNKLRDGVQLISGTFVDVADGNKQYLSQIKVDGYLKHAAFQQLGSDGAFNFYFLNQAGGTPDDKFYYWYHGCLNGVWDDEGKGWYDWDGNLVGTDVEDVELTPGDAIYLIAPLPDTDVSGEPIETFTFGDAGQVLAIDQSYTLVDGVNVVGNMMPITQKLSEITISGYLNHAAFQQLGSDGAFNFYFLNQAGGTPDEKFYYWYHGCLNGVWDDEGKGWYDWDGNLVGTDVEDVDLPPGQGIYLIAPIPDKDEKGDPKETFTIDFAAPKL